MIDLDAIEARIRDCKTYNFGLWNADKLAHEGAGKVQTMAINYTDTQVLSMILLALDEGVEGVRWIDVPDLLKKMIVEHWDLADEDSSSDEAEAAFAQLEPYIPDHRNDVQSASKPAEAWDQGYWKGWLDRHQARPDEEDNFGPSLPIPNPYRSEAPKKRGSTIMDGVLLNPDRPEPPFPGEERHDPSRAEIERAALAASLAGAVRYVDMHTLAGWMRVALRAAAEFRSEGR